MHGKSFKTLDLIYIHYNNTMDTVDFFLGSICECSLCVVHTYSLAKTDGKRQRGKVVIRLMFQLLPCVRVYL